MGSICEVYDQARTTNVNYDRFEKIVRDDELESQGKSLAVVGRKGWNSVINGVYLEDGMLNGRPRWKKRCEARWLKFNDASQWMVSLHRDGRALGEAFAADAAESPLGITETWHVCAEDKSWNADPLVSVTPGTCGSCQSSLVQLLCCGSCRRVTYCSRKCQRDDWRFHRRNCTARPRGSPPVPLLTEESILDERSSADEELQQSSVRKQVVPKPLHERVGTLDERPSERIVEDFAALPPSTSWTASGTWQERNLMSWARRRLMELLDGSCTDLSAPCGDVGHVEVLSVQEIGGIACCGESRGKRKLFFDLSFVLVFKATWLAEYGTMSTNGKVKMLDFDSELMADPHTTCGMELEFNDEIMNPMLTGEQRRLQEEATQLSCRQGDVLNAVGATHWNVLRGEGLMYKVHQRLRIFLQEFYEQ